MQLPALDKLVRFLEATSVHYDGVAASALPRVEGQRTLLEMKTARLAAALLPNGEPRSLDQSLDQLSAALDVPALSARAQRERAASRGRELQSKIAHRPTTSEVGAAHAKSEELEDKARALRHALAEIDSDPSVQAVDEGKPSGFFASRTKAKSERALGMTIEAALKERDAKRATLGRLEEELRRAAAAVAAVRVREQQADAAVRALARTEADALAEARATLAAALVNTSSARLAQVCTGDAVRCALDVLLVRAKARYLGALGKALPRAPGRELADLSSAAVRWRVQVADGHAGMLPPDAFIEARTREVVDTASRAAARFLAFCDRIDTWPLPATVDPKALAGEGPCFWDWIFEGFASDDAEALRGDFIEEVREAHARARPSPSAPEPEWIGETESDAASTTRGAVDAVFTATARPSEDDDETGSDVGSDIGSWFEHNAVARRPAKKPLLVSSESTLVAEHTERRIGPFVLLRPLGSGGMAEVHLARREGARDELLVIKLIHPNLARDAEFVSMFEREARIGAQLRHDNIVRIDELVEIRGQRVLTMEYVDGLSAQRLSHVLEKLETVMPWEVATLIVQDAARGLAHAHATQVQSSDGVKGRGGVVHRDISPDNLLTTTTGVTKILDFGIARGVEGDTLTRTGQLKGKIPFIAPETYEGAPPSSAMDVFALGVSLYWFLTRQRPFTGPTDGAIIRAIMTETPKAPGNIVEGLPPEIELITLEMLAKNPADRPEAVQVERLLSQFTGGARAQLAALVVRAMKQGVVAGQVATPAPVKFS